MGYTSYLKKKQIKFLLSYPITGIYLQVIRFHGSEKVAANQFKVLKI